MTLFIPTIGTKLVLQKDWTFSLQNEYRNRKFWETIFNEPCPTHYWEEPPTSRLATLPAGTILTVDRIYIRKGASDFDSLTFNLAKATNPFNTSGRFWVKLSDANQMDIEVV